MGERGFDLNLEVFFKDHVLMMFFIEPTNLHRSKAQFFGNPQKFFQATSPVLFAGFLNDCLMVAGDSDLTRSWSKQLRLWRRDRVLEVIKAVLEKVFGRTSSSLSLLDRMTRDLSHTYAIRVRLEPLSKRPRNRTKRDH